MDPHRNLFFYYRGRRPGDETVWEQQVEDNVTKALVNILELVPIEHCLLPFLKCLRIPIMRKGPLGSRQFGLQSLPQDSATHRYLAVITGKKQSTAERANKGEQSGGRPDAWIYIPEQSLAVMIESKLGANVDKDQLRGHLLKAGWSEDTPRRQLTWADVYGCFVGSCKEATEGAGLLLSQFLKFLEDMAMVPFHGFNENDFNFLFTFDAGYRPIIRSRLESFAQAVHEQLPEQVKSIFPNYEVGKIVGQQYLRPNARISRRGVEKGPFRHTNLTLELDQEGLFINAVIRDGSIHHSASPIACLARAMDDDCDGFTKLLSELGQGYQLRVWERRPRQGTRFMPGNEVWVPKASLSLDVFNMEGAHLLRSLLERIHLPGIHVGLLISRVDVLGSEADKLVSRAVSTVEKLVPVITFAEKGAVA